MARQERVDLYRGADKQWRWRFVAKNGRILAESSEGYIRKADAVHCLELVLNGDVVPHQTWTEFTPAPWVREVVEVRVLTGRAAQRADMDAEYEQRNPGGW